MIMNVRIWHKLEKKNIVYIKWEDTTECYK